MTQLTDASVCMIVNNFQNEQVVKAIAKHFVETMLEVRSDMFDDLTDEEQNKCMLNMTADSVRGETIDYAVDVLNEFKHNVLEELKSLQFTPNIKRKLTYDLKFFDSTENS